MYRFKSRPECQYCATLLFNEKPKFQVQLTVVCTNDVEEQVCFIAKDFTLQEVTITVGCRISEMPAYFNMPFNYTTNNISAISVKNPRQ
jgi:hypothetical protein